MAGNALFIIWRSWLNIFAYSSILTCLILLPFISDVVIAFLPAARIRLIRNSAMTVFVGMFAITIVVARLLNWRANWQLQQNLHWFVGLQYHVGADSLTALALLALAGTSLITALASYVIDQYVKVWYVLLLLLSGSLAGALCSMNLMLFAGFGAISIIPGYFLFGLWGGPSRRAAAMKYAMIATLGAMALFVAVMFLWVQSRQLAALHNTSEISPLLLPHAESQGTAAIASPHFADGSWRTQGTFDIRRLATLLGGHGEWIAFLLVLAALAIRMGLPGGHIWLPDALAEGAVPGVGLVVGGNFILGIYMLVRMVLSLFYSQFVAHRSGLVGWGIVGLVYAALCALAQSDLRRLIAYWLVSQAAMVLLAAATLNYAGVQAIVLFAGGDTFTLLLLLWSGHVLSRRTAGRDLNSLGGKKISHNREYFRRKKPQPRAGHAGEKSD